MTFIFLSLICFWTAIGTAEIFIQGKDESGRVFVSSGLYLNDINLEWFVPSKQQQAVKSSSKAYVYWQDNINERNYVLVVRSVTTDDSGLYVCRMGRQDGDQYREIALDQVDVTVERSVIATDCPNEQWIPMTESLNSRSSGFAEPMYSVTIRCVVEALPAPVVHWRFKGSNLVTGQRYITSVVGLTIFNPTQADEGLYTVIANQPNNTVVFDIRVLVFRRPRIVHGPVILGPYEGTVVSGGEAYLQCLAEGFPPPTIHWYRLRDPQTELQRLDPRKFFVNTNAKVGKLRITQADFPEDSDVYICRAILPVPNAYGSSREERIDEGYLRVNVTLTPRLIPLNTMHQFVDVEGTVTVHCKVRATDPLQFYYTKWNSNHSYVLGTQPHDPRIEVRFELDAEDALNHNLYLTIRNASHHDTWNYTCHAHNVGLPKCWNTTIQVMQRPQMMPRSNTEDKDEWSALRFGWRDNSTNLSCSSFGMPHPVWTWYRRGEQILNGVNSTFTIISLDYWNWSQSWLQVQPCRHTEHFIYDEYVCKATNLRGTNQSRVQFRRASVPGQPVLIGHHVTQSTIEIFIGPPLHTGGLYPIGYELHYTISGQGGWYGPVYFPLDTSTGNGRPKMRLHGLIGGTGYQIRLSARNIVGTGTSLSFVVRTLDSTRPGPVQIVDRYVANDPYSHVINWIPPLEGGLPITGYRIRLRPVVLRESSVAPKRWFVNPVIVSHGAWYETSPLFNNPYLSYYHLTNLDPDQVYQVVVEAVNALGRSLDGVDIDRFGYVNRTPSESPIVHYGQDREEAGHCDRLHSTHCLIPIWSVFRTPTADPYGRPPLVFGRASLLVSPKIHSMITFLRSSIIVLISRLYFIC
ncbi:unnamed protein product [Dicrocoelium dendriticum]|nr:unnamed protein product [Dicrocoelium dendriticum]